MNKLSKAGVRYALLTLFFLAPLAEAHPLAQDRMTVGFEPDRVRVTLDITLQEILIAQKVTPDGEGDFDSEALPQALAAHGDYLLGHLHLAAAGEPLRGQVLRHAPPGKPGRTRSSYCRYELAYAAPEPRPPVLTISQDMLREYSFAPGISWQVTFAVRRERSAVLAGLLGKEGTINLKTGWAAAPGSSPPASSTLTPVGEPEADSGGNWRTFTDYFRFGFWHILTGYDHLLFVAALVLAVSSLRDLIKVIAAFTLAHTVTLGLSVFDIFRLPSGIVEPVIALSIVFVALENVLFPRRARSPARLAVAFCFGLIHGLGFAGGLLEAMEGLPGTALWIALAAFSLGVETGHQTVVLPVFGLLRLGDRTVSAGARELAGQCASAAIAGAGAYFLVLALRQQFAAG